MDYLPRKQNELLKAIELEKWSDVSEICKAHPELVNTYDEDGRTPLAQALRNKAPEETALLLLQCANKDTINFKDRDFHGRNLLHQLSWFSYSTALACAVKLLDNVNAQDYNGRTPLHWCLSNEQCTYKEHMETTKSLLNGGALTTLKDNNGMTPIDAYLINNCRGYEENTKKTKKTELFKILKEATPATKMSRHWGKRSSTQLSTTESKELDFLGGILTFNGIKLIITQNAIDRGKKVKVHLADILNEETSTLQPTDTHISPMVYCGPAGTVFNQRCLLSMPHNIVDKKCWKFTGFVIDTPGGSWRKIKDDDKDYRFYVKNGRCFIELKHFSIFKSVITPVRHMLINMRIKPVNMKVVDNWHINEVTGMGTYKVNIVLWRHENEHRDSDSVMNLRTFSLSLNDLIIRLEDIPEEWCGNREMSVDESLVWQQYSDTFTLEAQARMVNKLSGKICLHQNGVRLKPHIKIPHLIQVQVPGRETDTPNIQASILQNQINRSDSKIKFIDLRSNISKLYEGKNYKWLRFLLFDHLHIELLSNNKTNGMTLFNKLVEQGDISCTNVVILSEIANVTNLESAKIFITKYKQSTQCEEGNVLTAYRKTLFRALREVGEDELSHLIANYELDRYHDKFIDVWDLTFHLEKEELLSNSPTKWKKFASHINGTAKNIMLAEMEIIFCEEAEIKRQKKLGHFRKEKCNTTETAEKATTTKQFLSRVVAVLIVLAVVVYIIAITTLTTREKAALATAIIVVLLVLV